MVRICSFMADVLGGVVNIAEIQALTRGFDFCPIVDNRSSCLAGGYTSKGARQLIPSHRTAFHRFIDQVLCFRLTHQPSTAEDQESKHLLRLPTRPDAAHSPVHTPALATPIISVSFYSQHDIFPDTDRSPGILRAPSAQSTKLPDRLWRTSTPT